jgi:hypothetical protein
MQQPSKRPELLKMPQFVEEEFRRFCRSIIRYGNAQFRRKKRIRIKRVLCHELLMLHDLPSRSAAGLESLNAISRAASRLAQASAFVSDSEGDRISSGNPGTLAHKTASQLANSGEQGYSAVPPDSFC